MDAAEIEQTNKVRVALGLAPLPVPNAPPVTFKASAADSDSEEEPASTLETREAAGYGNWKQLQDEAEAKQRREAKSAAIKKARDAAQRFTKIDGKGLGDADNDEDLDAKSWLKSSNKRQKKIELERRRRLEEELAERERLTTVEYSSKDLKGLAIGHEVGAFEDADGEQILTLKDRGVTGDDEDDEGDELEVQSLREREKLNEKLQLKKKKPLYDPNAIDETGEKKILQQYDEEIGGKKRKAFLLDDDGAVAEDREAKRQSLGYGIRGQKISLDFEKLIPQSDYMDISEVKIKKPKKSKKKSTRQRATDEDDTFPLSAEVATESNAVIPMDVDGTKPGPAAQISNDKSFLDDDNDLHLSLAAQRKKALRKLRPEDIAKQIQAEASASPEEKADQEEGGLLIDETTEFIENLRREPEKGRASKPKSEVRTSVESPDHAQVSGDEDGDVDMARIEKDAFEHARREESAGTPDMTRTGLEEEQTVDQGIGATLKLLRERGAVRASEQDLNASDRQREKFLREKRRLVEEAEQKARLQRQHERESGNSRMSNKEREEQAYYINQAQSQAVSRNVANLFDKEYKPNVNIRHVDEFGRELDAKNAFRYLSHQFHGKGSGNTKTTKALKKIEDEKRREANSLLDASKATGMNNAQGTTAKKNKQAGVRLA